MPGCQRWRGTDRLALSWYCLESLSSGEATEPGQGQMGPDHVHAPGDQPRQTRAVTVTREPDRRCCFCHRRSHRGPQDQGHANRTPQRQPVVSRHGSAMASATELAGARAVIAAITRASGLCGERRTGLNLVCPMGSWRIAHSGSPSVSVGWGNLPSGGDRCACCLSRQSAKRSVA
jgi:hypothetical protein